MWKIFFTIVLLTLPAHANEASSDQSSAVILAYQRVSENTHHEGNLRLNQFIEHINEIRRGGYNVLPLPTIIAALKNQTPLPQKTLAITFDGAFPSALNTAAPILIKNDLPFTIFTPTENADWKTLKKLNKSKLITLGIMSHQYTRITALPAAEQRRQINKARSAFKEKTGKESQYFAYPFGEISNTLKSILKEQNLTAAFGLHSGAAYEHTDTLQIPRFIMTENFGDITRFRNIINATALPATDTEPQNWKLERATAPAIGFTLPKPPQNLSCFISGQEKPTLEIIGNRVEIRPQEPITANRTRINCTQKEGKSWRWLGMLLHR
ncbi:MAG: polysaccharide deacetylase family protein [Alphaproteobacteria bacterium]